MFNTILNDIFISTDTSLPIRNVVICIMVALALGIILATTYFYITKHMGCSQSFFVSMIILPMLITLVIILISGNLTRALSMAGIFTLVRFRSTPGDAKDLSFVFSAMAIGVASGLGYLVIAGIITLLVCIIFFLTYKLGVGKVKEEEQLLKIVIPEDLNYTEAFEDLFEKYILRKRLKRIKTTNLGALYELSYIVVLKKDIAVKEMMDELRCRNGNLMISLSCYERDMQLL